MKKFPSLLAVVPLMVAASATAASTGSLNVEWTSGAPDCAAAAPPPLQVHGYNADTYILRQDPCASFEANFLYLLVGKERALLIDSGDVEDAAAMPLAETVMGLLPVIDDKPMPLLVAHTHGHRDHRRGDVQFESLPGVEVPPVELDALAVYFGFERWPEGEGEIDLGNRVIDVLPAPGHHPAHLVFHDRETGLLFTGDFLLPGRLMVDDAAAYRASAERLANFVRDREITHVLGGHVELDAGGGLYPRGASHHPNERRLELAKEDVLALPGHLASFNGFYASHENYVITNPVRNLMALAALVLVVLGLFGWGVRALLRYRRASR